MKLTLNSVEFDLSGVLPLRVRDWRALEKQGLKLRDLEGQLSFETAAILGQYVLKKANPKIADDFVDDLTLAEVMQIAKAVPQAEVAALDRPT